MACIQEPQVAELSGEKLRSQGLEHVQFLTLILLSGIFLHKIVLTPAHGDPAGRRHSAELSLMDIKADLS